ncbi:hypothetical protein C4573_01395 [Candidatus Woesearchaeota archaeon]|nr:MAG: hypothetical protein C4573_01395 [Candidatus Woesearchaeota archaeon]
MKNILFIAITISLLVLSGCAKKDYTTFAQCLTENNASMYGAYWCSHCANQKKEFGSAFMYINYVECDAKGAKANPALCEEKGIQGYPTWEIHGILFPGEMPLDKLSGLSGCPLS